MLAFGAGGRTAAKTIAGGKNDDQEDSESDATDSSFDDDNW